MLLLFTKHFSEVVGDQLVVYLERFYQRDPRLVVELLERLGVRLQLRFVYRYELVFNRFDYNKRNVEGVLHEEGDRRLVGGEVRLGATAGRLKGSEEKNVNGPQLQEDVRLYLGADVVVLREAVGELYEVGDVGFFEVLLRESRGLLAGF